MSQKVSRKSATAVSEEKEKRQTQSPVKEMKKKMAANAEKEKQAAEKALDKNAEKTVEKVTEKPAEKAADKAADKAEKQEKNEKPEKGDKKAEKVDKTVDKKSEKAKEEQKKPDAQSEKSKADKSDSSKEDKSGKPSEKPDPKKAEPSKAKQNGRDRVHNGVSDVTLGTNGTDDVLNGTVKATRTPETPRPASDKQPDKDADDPKDKVLKLKEDAPVTDRRLRSSNSPKPQEGKKEKLLDSPKKSDLEKVEEKDEDAAKNEKSQEVEVVLVEPAANEGEESQDKERSKTDTNFSKSRVKVSPYRRSMRIADQTNTSLQANYTGNNTTMEMDITETSSFMEDAPLDDSSYLRGLRSIRGRSSYKQLKEITLRHVANKSARSAASTSLTSPASESQSRPTGTVVGRKRKPETDDVELGVELTEREPSHAPSKRMRVLERLAEPFRRVAAAAHAPSIARRNAEIVGINTDLPLSAPVASADTFDPETLKPAAALVPETEPVAVPLHCDDKDNKRCVIM
ncbi:hypothetical protein PYW08_009896 [Mythimna loreyi]|uniref:Uncharacterized protein n=1 Tax=Mythimna loreyi TaxID=667449 RepID=A0ACC2Q7R7_9NEOP|nr:hypothetical protein PYW08_009896 [Mythimna loreyi]